MNTLRRFNAFAGPEVDAFATSVARFASSLSGNEQRILESVLMASLSPHEAMDLRRADDLLSADELQFLHSLEQATPCDTTG